MKAIENINLPDGEYKGHIAGNILKIEEDHFVYINTSVDSPIAVTVTVTNQQIKISNNEEYK